MTFWSKIAKKWVWVPPRAVSLYSVIFDPDDPNVGADISTTTRQKNFKIFLSERARFVDHLRHLGRIHISISGVVMVETLWPIEIQVLTLKMWY